ncbi:MAG: DegV family protein, partial [Anaerolineae bacterium]
TDSSANVPPQMAEQLDIRVVPIVLALNGHTFRDGVEITAHDVYRWLRDSRHSPTTSAPSVGDFVRTYANAAQEADGIVSIHMSPKLSGTFNAASAASRLVDDVPIEVIGCPSAAMGQGFAVLAAARAAQAGQSLAAARARAEQVAAKVNVLATIGTLEYLHRGGRIGGAAALLGAMLQIKPVLCLTGGDVDVFARPRTQAKAVRAMLDHMARQVNGCQVHAAVLHADVPEEAQALRQKLAERFDCAELYVTELTPVMSAHTGPGVLGVVYYAEDQDEYHAQSQEGAESQTQAA